MTFDIKKQESFSRGQLLLRALFGWLYIAIPHAFLLVFVGIWGAILQFIAWWVVLFTGKYPQSWFEYQVNLMAWSNRLYASLYNLTDEYPAFGLSGKSDVVTLDIPYPSSISRGLLILRALFGIIYVAIPHGFCLYFRLIGSMVVMFCAWWVVLFTGNYPENMHRFNVGTLRWMNRFGAYNSFLTDEYPPFSGK